MDDGHTMPELGKHVVGMLRDRGWSPFEAMRFARLPFDAQFIGMVRLEADEELGARELLESLEEEVERRRRAE
jgi:hypothetical protein